MEERVFRAEEMVTENLRFEGWLEMGGWQESDGSGDAGKVGGSSLASPVATSRFHAGQWTEVLTLSG